jgi:hypothetical protein
MVASVDFGFHISSVTQVMLPKYHRMLSVKRSFPLVSIQHCRDENSSLLHYALIRHRQFH